jgi:hypothetical protein
MLSKKFFSFAITVFVISGAAVYVVMQNRENTPNIEINANGNIISKRAYASKLHSDILNLIALKTEPVCGISPEEAQKEIEDRDDTSKTDSLPVEVKELPFGILQLIAKSSTSIAGINPKSAMNEAIRRYISIDLTDSDDMNSSILLEALQRYEQGNIEKWADNEDNEAIEAFMKEEADREISSVANVIYGLKHLNGDRENAKTYMDRYAEHAHSDAFDTQNEEESYNILAEAIKNLK